MTDKMHKNSSLYMPFRQAEEGDDDDDMPNEENLPAAEPQSPLSMWAKRSDQLFFEKRAVYLWGAVEDKSAKDIVNRLLLLDADKPGEEIKFFINSPGGVVTSGFVIYDVMQMIKSPVRTICMGLAASMGSVLLAGGTPGKRAIFPHGEVMIHQPSLGGYMRGVSADLEIQAIQIQKTKEMIARIYEKTTPQPYDRIMRDLERDYWMDAEASLKYGIVDEIIDKMP